MKLKPLADKIVVKPEERLKSSILQVVMTEQPNMGTVVAVGPGKLIKNRRQEMPVKVGDFVRYGTMGDNEYLKYFEYMEDGERYLVMSWQDVCFIQEKSDAMA